MAGFKDSQQPAGVVVIGHTGFLIQIINGHTVQFRDFRKDHHIRQGGVALPTGDGLGADTQGFRRLLLGHIFCDPQPLQVF